METLVVKPKYRESPEQFPCVQFWVHGLRGYKHGKKKLCVRPFTWIEAWCFPSLNGCGVYHVKPDEPDTLPSTFYMTGDRPIATDETPMTFVYLKRLGFWR